MTEMSETQKAAGVDMDALHAEALAENALSREARQAIRDAAHAEAQVEDADRTMAAEVASGSELQAVEVIKAVRRFADMRKTEMQRLCTRLGIKGTANMTARMLIELLEQAEREGRVVQPEERAVEPLRVNDTERAHFARVIRAAKLRDAILRMASRYGEAVFEQGISSGDAGRRWDRARGRRYSAMVRLTNALERLAAEQ